MNYMIETWGCQMNERDSEILAGFMEKMGYRQTNDHDDADVIILNTCCVREKAEKKVYGKLGEYKRLKSKNPELILAICGCMVQQPEVAAKIRQRAPYVDLLFGTHNLHQLPDLLEQVKRSRESIVEIWEQEGKVVEDLPSHRAHGVKAYVSITYGCNNFCTYCIVPYVRGRERSRRPEDILNEIAKLGQAGYKEVTLLGQNVNSYGKDLEEKVDFADLLARIESIPGIEWVRYMTSHPRDFSEKLIDTIAASRKVCEHFHLPIQAGSNTILEKMNRGYTREHYLDLITRICAKVPNCSVTTDLIVGFPGETEKDFQDTLEIVETVRFDAAYTFIYSPRKGTPAARMPFQVEENIKKERLQRLMELQNRISREINENLVGQIVDGLVEGFSKNNPSKLSARTRTNKIIIFEGDPDLMGRIIPFKIKEAQTWNLLGEPVQTMRT